MFQSRSRTKGAKRCVATRGRSTSSKPSGIQLCPGCRLASTLDPKTTEAEAQGPWTPKAQNASEALLVLLGDAELVQKHQLRPAEEHPDALPESQDKEEAEVAEGGHPDLSRKQPFCSQDSDEDANSKACQESSSRVVDDEQ